MRIISIITCFLLFYTTTNFAQIEVKVALDSNTIKIGEHLKMHLEVKHDKGETVQFPELKTLGEKVEVIETTPITTVEENDKNIESQTLTLTAFDSGWHVIPPIPLSYNDGKDTVYSNPLQLMVTTVGVDTAGILAPIKDILLEPLSFNEDVLPYLLGVVGIGLLTLLGFYFYRRNKNKINVKNLEKEVIQLPPHIVAFKKLSTLEDKKLWQKGEIKSYQSELTHIVREYLENRFDIVALETTTEEILTQVKGLEIESGLKMKLKQMLELADLVKFAKVKPSLEQHEVSMTDAKLLVEQTKKEPLNEAEEVENSASPISDKQNPQTSTSE